MKIAVIGVSGRVGCRVTDELARRGHEISGIARRLEGLEAPKGVTLRQGDATQSGPLATLLRGHDAVISATRSVDADPHALIEAVKSAGVPRLLVVGGAASLEIAPGKAMIDSPSFPDAYKPEGRAGLAFLHALRGEKDLDWIFLSPSAQFEPGPRTGKFRVGGEQLLTDSAGKSWISMEDFAIAMADEVEAPKHSRECFTVGY
jgi:putative NADH-flavin reductase